VSGTETCPHWSGRINEAAPLCESIDGHVQTGHVRVPGTETCPNQTWRILDDDLGAIVETLG
jgi:hypothetical protein